jgi:hypothetical protein
MSRLHIFPFIKHKRINLNRKREEFDNEDDWLVYKQKRGEVFARIEGAKHRKKMKEDPIYMQKESDWWAEVDRKREAYYERWDQLVKVNNKLDREMKLSLKELNKVLNELGGM